MIQKTSTQCRREGLNYAVQCGICLGLGMSTTYRGESSRSARQHHKEHVDGLHQGLAANPLVMHCVEEHGGVRAPFIFTIVSHSADVTGITNITAGNPIVWTFMSTENEANSRIIFTKWLREGLLNSLHYTT